MSALPNETNINPFVPLYLSNGSVGVNVGNPTTTSLVINSSPILGGKAGLVDMTNLASKTIADTNITANSVILLKAYSGGNTNTSPCYYTVQAGVSWTLYTGLPFGGATTIFAYFIVAY